MLYIGVDQGHMKFLKIIYIRVCIQIFAFALVGNIAFAQAQADSAGQITLKAGIPADWFPSVCGLVNSGEYSEIANEIAYRSQYSGQKSQQFESYDTKALILANAILDRQYFYTSPSDTFLCDTLDNFVKSGASFDELLSFVFHDRRVLTCDLDSNYSEIASEAIQRTVLIVPKNRPKFGGKTPIIGSFKGKRKEIYDWISGAYCDTCRFQEQAVFERGTRSGVLLKPRWILTAGHNLLPGDECIVVRKFEESTELVGKKFRAKNISTGTIRHVEFGAAQQPDFALIQLSERFKVPKMDIDSRCNPSKPLFMNGHQLGMQMVADNSGSVARFPGSHWKKNYFFADLHTYSGTSGAPVFSYEIIDGMATNPVLQGIVIGGGGLDDFVEIEDDCNGRNFKWNPRPLNNAVGTRVLRLDAIDSVVGKIIRRSSVIPKSVRNEAEDEGDTDNLWLTANINTDSVFVVGAELHVRKRVRPQRMDSICKLDSIVSVFLCDSTIKIYKNRSLKDNYYTDAQSRLPVHQELWPLDIQVAGEIKHHLEFKKGDRFVVDGTPLPTADGETYNLLDGIGVSDVVDELPDLRKYNRHFMWLCDCEYIELQAINMDNNEKPAISIKTVKPLVPIYLRTELADPKK